LTELLCPKTCGTDVCVGQQNIQCWVASVRTAHPTIALEGV